MNSNCKRKKRGFIESKEELRFQVAWLLYAQKEEEIWRKRNTDVFKDQVLRPLPIDYDKRNDKIKL